jgi:hypothetical protein
MRITSSSGLPVDATTDDFNICSIFRQSQVNFEQFVVIFNDVGNCVLTLTQDGNDDFNPAEETYVSFEILPNKTTITCVKGKLTKKVTGINPKCPTGYRKK